MKSEKNYSLFCVMQWCHGFMPLYTWSILLFGHGWETKLCSDRKGRQLINTNKLYSLPLIFLDTKDILLSAQSNLEMPSSFWKLSSIFVLTPRSQEWSTYWCYWVLPVALTSVQFSSCFLLFHFYVFIMPIWIHLLMFSCKTSETSYSPLETNIFLILRWFGNLPDEYFFLVILSPGVLQ